ELSKYQNNQPCPSCDGTRLRREARHVRIGTGDYARGIYEISGWPLRDALGYFDGLTLDGAKREIADKVIKEIVARLTFLNNVGLDYRSLERSAETLSGGEAQRVKLSLELSKRDTGRTLYILDEPTTGLHFHDIALLLEVIHRLRDQGNTVVIIEHNLDVIKTADWVIDLGP
ncbi:ATP-binding cassette domain-containing protein, partial [Bacillus subtilis]|nr:ATP-binding cassette domain-containing protein [Bacillus subtilis]